MAEYIEREAALDCFTCDLSKKDHSVSYQGFMTEAAFRINDIPAVDVAPVRHGRWQSWTQDRPPCKWYSCDYCGFHALSKSNYCPNCGAKMDKYGLSCPSKD